MEDIVVRALMRLPDDVRDQIAQQVMEGVRSKAWESFPVNILEGLPEYEQNMTKAAYDLGVQHGMSVMAKFLGGKISLDAERAPEFTEMMQKVRAERDRERTDEGPEGGEGEDESVQAAEGDVPRPVARPARRGVRRRGSRVQPPEDGAPEG